MYIYSTVYINIYTIYIYYIYRDRFSWKFLFINIECSVCSSEAPSSPERSGTPSALAVALDVPVAAAPAPAAPAAEAAEAPVTTVTTVAEESRGSREVEFRPASCHMV